QARRRADRAVEEAGLLEAGGERLERLDRDEFAVEPAHRGRLDFAQGAGAVEELDAPQLAGGDEDLAPMGAELVPDDVVIAQETDGPGVEEGMKFGTFRDR